MFPKSKIDESCNIKNLLDPDRQSIASENRGYMKMLLQYHKLFCAEEMAYRGHDEADQSLDVGKRREFINLTLRTNPKFRSPHAKIKQQFKVYDYTSMRSCNELIGAMADEIRNHIK